MKKLLFGDRNRIGRRLIILIIAFSSLITLLISAAQLIFEYRELRKVMDRELEGLTIYVPSIAGSVWDFDERQIQRALDALALLPNIDRVRVVTADDQRQWSSGKGVSASVVTKTYSLRHVVRGKETEIGTFEVVASLNAIYRRVAARAVSIVSSNALKTFLVALFMAFLFRRLVTGRLEVLGRKVDKLTPNMLRWRKTGEAEPEPIPQHLDELSAVEWTLDNTARSLDAAVSALHDVNLQLEHRVAEKEALLQNALVGIVMLRRHEIISCNRRFEEIFGYEAGTLVGHSTRIFYPSEDEFVNIGELADETLGRGLNFSRTLMLVRRDGTRFWAELTGRAFDSAHAHDESIWIFSDITERKRAEEKIQFIAYHDALTELPNRLLAQDRFQQAVAFADRAQSRIAVLFLDLDNFKTINDSLGHSIGDGLIKHVAERLKSCVRDTDTVSRQGGDEFLILLPNLPDSDATAPILVKMMERLLEPCIIEGQELNTSVSVGVAVYPEDGADFDTLMKKADMAMYRAKDAGRNTYRFFDAQMNVEAIEQLSMRNGLRRALERREFVLHYQPQIDLRTGVTIGAEALIRWNHPEYGMIPPGRFITIAEDSGLIVPIGEWVLREACRQVAVWSKAGLSDFVVAVNLSAVQFKRGDLEQSVVSALRESGIDPSMLELELTESILINNTEGILATVKRLKHLGLKLSIDDFGTGYSSLSYLKRFEVDKLKIDQSFVRDLGTDPEDAAIVRAIIQMAHSLGLITIAEGVEDERVLNQLRAFGCDEAQGYFFARPMPAADLMGFFSKGQGRAAVNE